MTTTERARRSTQRHQTIKPYNGTECRGHATCVRARACVLCGGLLRVSTSVGARAIERSSDRLSSSSPREDDALPCCRYLSRAHLITPRIAATTTVTDFSSSSSSSSLGRGSNANSLALLRAAHCEWWREGRRAPSLPSSSFAPGGVACSWRDAPSGVPLVRAPDWSKLSANCTSLDLSWSPLRFTRGAARALATELRRDAEDAHDDDGAHGGAWGRPPRMTSTMMISDVDARGGWLWLARRDVVAIGAALGCDAVDVAAARDTSGCRAARATRDARRLRLLDAVRSAEATRAAVPLRDAIDAETTTMGHSGGAPRSRPRVGHGGGELDERAMLRRADPLVIEAEDLYARLVGDAERTAFAGELARAADARACLALPTLLRQREAAARALRARGVRLGDDSRRADERAAARAGAVLATCDAARDALAAATAEGDCDELPLAIAAAQASGLLAAARSVPTVGGGDRALQRLATGAAAARAACADATASLKAALADGCHDGLSAGRLADALRTADATGVARRAGGPSARAVGMLATCDDAEGERANARRRFEDQLFRGNRHLDKRQCRYAAREFADARAAGPSDASDLRDPALRKIWADVLEWKDEQVRTCAAAVAASPAPEL